MKEFFFSNQVSSLIFPEKSKALFSEHKTDVSYFSVETCNKFIFFKFLVSQKTMDSNIICLQAESLQKFISNLLFF